MTSIGQRAALASLPGGSWKDVALAAMQASEGCRRDFSVRANPQVQAAIAKMDSKSRAQLSRLDAVVQATRAKTVAKTRAKTKAKTTKGKAASEDGNEWSAWRPASAELVRPSWLHH